LVENPQVVNGLDKFYLLIDEFRRFSTWYGDLTCFPFWEGKQAESRM
jgi:hypothetical protein